VFPNSTARGKAGATKGKSMIGKSTTLLLAVAAACLAQVNPKDIFVSGGGNGSNGGNRPAIKYIIQLNRDGEVRPVAASYRFQSGDKFRFLFESNQPVFVYLGLRSMEGDPDTMEHVVGAKGVIVVRDEPGKRPAAESRYHLLWPNDGRNVRLAAHQAQTVPASGQYFEFDASPGMEKIVLVASPERMDPEKLFPGARLQKQPAGSHDDSNDDVLGQLRKDIETMDHNTASVSDPSSKGICVGPCDNYSSPRNPTDPFLVVIDLRHFQ
jgi:hypothetical protein